MLVFLAVPIVLALPQQAQEPDFTREVRPILADRCFACHGPDADARKAGLRLDEREGATGVLASGRRAIVPGQPADSELLARISSDDPETVMPPPGEHAKLSEHERLVLERWIAAGAEYRPHWSFVAPLRPPVPGNGETHPIDAFVRARLDAEGLAPSPEADRETLCRRVHLDLIGLPPTPDELRAFVEDTGDDAYERLVDRLLASPRYGERQARRWLDLARYADTNGYEKDRPRSMWPYRDAVIRALNEDVPFDEFTVRQLAGDMLPEPTIDDVIATGFHRNTMRNEEGGIDPLEFRYLAMVDRVATTGATWLGLTVGCAQCHTHKFDPITHREYFALMGLLDNCDEPEWTIPDDAQLQKQARIEAQIEAAWAGLPSEWPASDKDGNAVPPVAERFAAWEREESARAIRWRIVEPQAWNTTLPHLRPRDDGSIFASGDATKSDVYTLELPAGDQPVRAIRLEVLPDEALPAHGPGLCDYEGPKGDFFLSEFEVTSNGEQLAIDQATDSFAGSPFASQKRAGAANAIDGEMSSGWSTNGEQGRAHAAVFELAHEVPAGAPITVTMRFERHYACGLGCFRLAVTDAEGAEARGHSHAEEAALAVPRAQRSDDAQRLVERRFLATASELSDRVQRIRQLENQLRAGTTTLVMRERPADNRRTTHRHHRGEFAQPREAVDPGVPAVLPQLPGDRPADRMALARWLVSPDHPLTARVAVNRHWAAFFGRGIVETLDDFGLQGSNPSHPELLDWLARAFVDDLDWSQKKLHRLIVTSATYRQDSATSPTLEAVDPDNVLLSRGPRVRLEAEQIRDSMLRAASLLSDKMFGPGVRPPQPDGVTEIAFGSPRWNASQGEDRYRRSIYTFQKRTAPFAMFQTFDGPSGETCVARRDRSDSPLQALTLLNDPMLVEIAQALGRRVQAEHDDDTSRLQQLGVRVLSREFEPEELADLSAFLQQQRARLAAGTLDAAKLAGQHSENAPEDAAWTLVARAVMNLDEAIVKR
ncbi:MAG: PSD1 and planctomycete cytochrome C domain-containing protein [Planctomycetota bacterium]|nr:PSD1 and planctomycete cytochrome C domain-containing protein [Planctomycetota bacterium]